MYNIYTHTHTYTYTYTHNFTSQVCIPFTTVKLTKSRFCNSSIFSKGA